jgi:hypothetical protein
MIVEMDEIIELTVPAQDLKWIGERMTNTNADQAEIEHFHRYLQHCDCIGCFGNPPCTVYCAPLPAFDPNARCNRNHQAASS